MAFEVFSKYANRNNQPPTLSVGKQGRIQLNKTACELFTTDVKVIQCVLLMWDKGANKVAIRPLQKKDRRGYRLNVNRAGGAALSCKSFIEYIGHGKQETKWFPAHWNEAEEAVEAELTQVSSLPVKQPARKIEEYGRRRKVS